MQLVLAYVWIHVSSHVCVLRLFFFFFFTRFDKTWLLFNEQWPQMLTFLPQTVHYVLFMDPQIPLFNNFFIKNGSHGTIYTFKNYFATVISVISFQFQQNKSYPNRPLDSCITAAFSAQERIFQTEMGLSELFWSDSLFKGKKTHVGCYSCRFWIII